MDAPSSPLQTTPQQCQRIMIMHCVGCLNQLEAKPFELFPISSHATALGRLSDGFELRGRSHEPEPFENLHALRQSTCRYVAEGKLEA